jgi:hypothetical protein
MVPFEKYNSLPLSKYPSIVTPQKQRIHPRDAAFEDTAFWLWLEILIFYIR